MERRAARTRRHFLRGSLALAGLGLLAGCGVLSSPVRQPAGVPRIGYLTSDRSASSDPFSDAFRQGLRELGYVEGENLTIEWRFAERVDLLPDLAAELVRLPVAVIVAAGAQAITAARDATDTIPIVMPVIGDPVRQGFVASLARPGDNITGLSSQSASELAAKRLQLLKETVPETTRVAVLWNSGNSAKVVEFTETERAAKALGVALQSVEVRGPHELDRAFGAAVSGQAEALSTFTDPLTLAHATRIADFARLSRLPSVFEVRPFVTAGGLIAYGPDTTDMYRRAATYTDRILKGANPADLPVEQPTRFDFVINLKTAQALGLTITQSVLQQATELIQ
jgi:putative ABC transport system substrate-binding protein